MATTNKGRYSYSANGSWMAEFCNSINDELLLVSIEEIFVWKISCQRKEEQSEEEADMEPLPDTLGNREILLGDWSLWGFRGANIKGRVLQLPFFFHL